MIKTINKNTIPTNNTTKSTWRDQIRIKNFSAYNNALVARGEVISIAKEAIRKSRLKRRSHRAGRPEEYSDAIIFAMVAYREMFSLPLRQTAGLARDIFAMLNVKAPSYITLHRRMSKLEINLPIDRRRLKRRAVLLVDSTGFKLTGEGEWKGKKHGISKRRTWTKVHYLIDYNSLQIVGVVVTADNFGDNLAVPDLLKQLPSGIQVDTLIGDGAYGTRALYKLVEEKYKATLIAPPSKNAVISKHRQWKTRDEYVKACQELGREAWKEQIGYHRRSLVETNMFRQKAAFGDKLRSKTIKNQTVEILIRAYLLNEWTNKYMPSYTK